MQVGLLAAGVEGGYGFVVNKVEEEEETREKSASPCVAAAAQTHCTVLMAAPTICRACSWERRQRAVPTAPPSTGQVLRTEHMELAASVMSVQLWRTTLINIGSV